MNSLLFLGAGSSMGVPVIGCQCDVCQSEDTRNKRTRSSALLKVNGKQILIDASPDLRRQALKHKISHIDGCIFTHAHQDHTGGIDDLRAFYFPEKKPIPCLASHETAEDIETRFYYMFKGDKKMEFSFPHGDRKGIHFCETDFFVASYYQMGMKVLGIRCGGLAYLTDIKDYPETLFQDMGGINTLVISALRFTPSPIHFNIDEACEFGRKVNAKSVYLTHVSHDVDYMKAKAYLPEHVKLAYDGLEIPF